VSQHSNNNSHPYVSQIDLNLRGINRRHGRSTFHLGSKTFIYGPNGSGKTTIINGVEFATTGRVSDLSGRDGASSLPLLRRLMSRHESDIHANAVIRLSDDQTLATSYRLPRSGKLESQTPPAFHVAFPLEDVKGVLTGQSNTARKWLIDNLCSDIPFAAIYATLPPEWVERYKAVCAYVDPAKAPTPAKMLVGVEEVLAARLRRARADVKRLQEQINVMAPTQPRPSPEDIREARNAMQKATARVDVPALRRQLTLAKQALATSEEDLRGALAVAQSAIPDIRKTLEAIVTLVKPEAKCCVLCGSESKKPAQLYVQAQMLLEKDDRAQASLRMVDTLRMSVNRAKATVDSLTLELQAAEKQGDMPDSSEDMHDRYRRLAGLEDAWTRTEQVRSEMLQAMQQENDTAPFLDVVRRTLGMLLEDARSSFVARVQGHLPAHVRFDVRLKDGNKDLCEIGTFAADGTFAMAQNGAGWLQMQLAIAAAMTTGADLTIYTNPDRGHDPKTLKDTLKALTDVPGQVLFASPTKPFGGLPAGWTLLDLSDE